MAQWAAGDADGRITADRLRSARPAVAGRTQHPTGLGGHGRKWTRCPSNRDPRILDRLDEVSLEDALTEAQLRIRQPLFTLIASALIVGNRSGGRLAPLLQELSRAAHQIEAVQGQLRAEQAQGRLGALVIALMPLALLVVLHVVNPQYLAPYSTLGGQLLLGALIAMIVVGYVWMLRILRLPQPDLLSLAPQVMPIQESIMGDLAKTASLRDVPGRATVVTFTRPAETEHLGK